MKGSLSPMKAWAHMSDYEGGVSPSVSPSSSPKNSKKHPRRTHPPPSTDDESDGEIKKPSKSNICTACGLQFGRNSNLWYPNGVANIGIESKVSGITYQGPVV